MKTFVPSALLAMAISACEPFTIPTAVRCLVMENRHVPGDRKGETACSGEPDTTLLVSAVAVPESYDWRRDTAYGNSGGRLLLYRNYSEVLSLETGAETEISTAASSHHLIGGHLFTEYAGDRGTVVKRDGDEICRYPEKERLLGLLPLDGDILTLGAPAGREGLVLRKNGSILLSAEGCSVFGSFDDAARGRSGALYTDGGHWYFAYRNGEACFLVRDGTVKGVSMPLAVTRVLAVKCIDDEIWMVGRNGASCVLSRGKQCRLLSPSITWEGAAILDCGEGGVCVYGYGRNTHGDPCGIVQWPETGKESLIPGQMAYPFCAPGGKLWWLGIDGRALALSEDGTVVLSERDCLFMGADCAAMAGNRLFLALNPASEGGRPFLWEGGRKRELDIYGYLTAVEVSPAR